MTQHNNGATPLQITRLTRVSQSQPTAWRGQTKDGRDVHLSYLYGRLTVAAREPVSGGTTWRTLLSVSTGALEAHHAAAEERERKVAGPQVARNLQKRLIENEAQLTGEIRGSNNIEGRRKARVVPFVQLQRWLEMLPVLGTAPVELAAWFET